jgi:hypothetical protein
MLTYQTWALREHERLRRFESEHFDCASRDVAAVLNGDKVSSVASI